MAADKPDLLERIFAKVQEQWGGWGVIVLAALIGVGLLLWHRKKLIERLGLGWVFSLIFRARLPRPIPGKFAVALTHLEGDTSHVVEDTVAHALADMSFVQTLRFDRRIPIGSGNLDLAIQAGHKQARKLLEKSGADLLLWGVALGTPPNHVPKLYWTPSRKLAAIKESDRYRIDERQSLPELAPDMRVVLQLHVANEAAAIAAQDGCFVANQLRPFIDKIRPMLADPSPAWTPEARAEVTRMFAQSLLTYGDQGGDNAALQEAVKIDRALLTESLRLRDRMSWAATQNNLGVALLRLGERQGDTLYLRDAVTAFRAALQECTRESTPREWAITQNNLGNALARLSQWDGDTLRLQEAIDAFGAAFRVRTRHRMPLAWAATQHNLGNALRRLGDREGDAQRLQAAVHAYQKALKVRTRKKVPLAWAMTQNNLGNAWRNLGIRQHSPLLLKEAITCYESALAQFRSVHAEHYVQTTGRILRAAQEDLAKLEGH